MRALIGAGLLAIAIVAGLIAADDPPAKSTAKSTAKKSTPSKKSATTPGEEFKKAGESADNYEKAGRAAGEGGRALGEKTADGDIVGGAADFGKGMGTMGKEVGVGTAKVGASVGKGIGRVFGGGSKMKSTPEPKQESKGNDQAKK